MKITTRILSSLAILSITGCNTYDTLDSERAVGSNPDETNPHYGQPYYLPKTMLRLQITKSGGGGGGGGGGTNMTQTVNVYPPGGSPPAKADGKTEDKPDWIAYNITLTPETVADHETGVLYLHYNQNWFYEEEVKVTVNDKNLLNNSETTSTDKTAQVIYNLADTAINLYKFGATGGLDAAASASFKRLQSMEPRVRRVLYKDLNVDFRFDPFNERDLKRLADLFTDDETRDAYYVSPFYVRVKTPASAGVSLPGKKPRSRKGLYFREPMALQVEIVGREAKFVSELSKSLGPALNAGAMAEDTLRSRQKLADAAYERDVAAYKAELAKWEAKPEAERGAAPRMPQKPADVLPSPEEDGAIKFAENMKQRYDRARGSINHRAERVTVLAHNKQRVFAYNVARSAFVSGKKQNLTIVDGALRGVHLVKPSEALGFSEIPLTLSNKLLDLPKGVLTLRQDITMKQAEILKQKGNVVNEQTNLNSAIANQPIKEETARLKAEKERLQAELELLKLKKDAGLSED